MSKSIADIIYDEIIEALHHYLDGPPNIGSLTEEAIYLCACSGEKRIRKLLEEGGGE